MVKGENFFDVENNPEILFVSEKLEWTSKDTAELKGKLTMRGTTKPVTFHVSLTPLSSDKISQAEKVLVKATASISRAEFGMKSRIEGVLAVELGICCIPFLDHCHL